jgi:hypothetical protein
LYLDQPLVSDDAGQFQILGFLHGLCWLHAERSLRKLLPFNPRERQALAALLRQAVEGKATTATTAPAVAAVKPPSTQTAPAAAQAGAGLLSSHRGGAAAAAAG